MSDTDPSTLNLPLETVLTTLVEQLDTLPTSNLSPDVVATLTTLQTKLQERRNAPLGMKTETEHQYDELLQFMSNAYLITDLNLRIQEVNLAACRMMGSTADKVRHHPLESYFSSAEQEVLRDKVRHMVDLGLPFQEWESVIVRPSGGMPVMMKTAVVRDLKQNAIGFRWLLRDISRRKQTNARLQRTYKLLLALVEASPKGIVMVDTQGRVQLWSDAAERILGWAQEEVLGQLPKHLSPEIMEEWLTHPGIHTGEGRHDEVEMICYRKDGSQILARIVTAALQSPEGQIVGWLQLFTDITKQHKMRLELQQMKARLAASREAEQRRLARGLHDDVIQQLIALQMDLASQRKQAEKSKDGAYTTGPELAQTLGRLEGQVVNTVRELRGVLRELRPAGLEEHGLIAALDGFLNQLTRQYPDRQLEIHKQWPPTPLNVPLPIATCFFKVAQEALRNVIRHTTAQKVDILLEQNSTHTIMEIRDDGEGFATQPQFAKLAHEGHFGLVGMLERVELCGGELEVKSTPGNGATILVRVPLITEV
jgi:PAS domain S-box-containing protein